MGHKLKRRDVLAGSAALAAAVAVGANTCGASAEEPGLEVYEIWGTIKWYDASKGYGFIVPDNRMCDVLLHRTCLERYSTSALGEGARVRAQVIRRPKGMQALRILELDRSSERFGLPQRTHLSVRSYVVA